MTETNSELKNIIEAALLVAGQPLTMEKLLTMFPEESRPTRDEVRAVLQALELEYAERPVELKQIDRAWRFQTRAKYASWVARLAEERPQRYSRALLETLAIIAYRQPVTRGDIEEIRGVSVSADIVRTLLERGWVREVGVRDVPGRPALLGTTREFLEHFNLKGLEDLPPLAALRDLAAIGAELDQRLEQGRTPEGDAGPPVRAAGAAEHEAVAAGMPQPAERE
ncbi:MAG: SMC-Scp complex subunit ScpB [Candidatus Muproteobacteria bacterium RIFCSPHIGHO2_02_FULL_65_16]|uniref:SMC-Scp complex subunit ScpB n=1 Tax=Candidatus Muproteobacteria bacterium RIFCSPHIGHO2_02_FULL_65_16 TaxID=1817766 RepID=A0A1F6U4D6_9PROT|nr:MAG: SMC-Scp complex subunit ScpB [Candidatus Muproteobacteria bacterium RIFCSPHIGHO2_02_FULL_65_16]